MVRDSVVSDLIDSSGQTEGDSGLGKDWPWLLGVALLVGVAMSIAAYSLGSGTTTVTLMSTALIALALAQIVGLLRSYLSQGAASKIADGQIEIVQTVNRISNETRRLNSENISLARSVEQFHTETSALNNGLSESLASLREGHASVAENLRSILDAQRDIQFSLASQANQSALKNAIAREQEWVAQVTEQPLETEPVPVAEAPIAAPTFAQSGLAEALNLSLEPVIDLYTSNTAHYRMMLGMTNDQGKDVEHEVFVHHADRIGLRDSLDVHVVGQTLELLEQLRQRDPNLSIFVPVGATTLANPEAVQQIMALLRAAPDQSQGVVLDLVHATLASLHETSLEGLATLARAGVNLSLSQASIAGVDLAALSRLNVRFVSIAASSIGVGTQISAGLPGFVQSARALRIQVIVSQVGDPRHVPGLARTARFASGPAFALPRKLKRTVTEEASPQAAAA
jgi:EAL domain-containing protein (putative c-di-GMP-specific phosphodiesterase class I)